MVRESAQMVISLARLAPMKVGTLVPVYWLLNSPSLQYPPAGTLPRPQEWRSPASHVPPQSLVNK